MNPSRFTGIAVCIAAAVAACNHAPPEITAGHQIEKPWTQLITHLSNVLSPAPPPFEGEIQLEVHPTKESTPFAVTYEVKGDRVRYDKKPAFSSAPASVHTVADLDQRKAFEVLDAKKQYVEVDPGSISAETANAQLKMTGKTETIAGVACEDLQIISGPQQVDVCATKGIPYFDLSGESNGTGMEPAWAAELTKAKEFPLRVVVNDKTGHDKSWLEAKSVLKKKLDDGLFALPADYHKEAAPVDVPVQSIL
jgi:hypothetical protein